MNTRYRGPEDGIPGGDVELMRTLTTSQDEARDHMMVPPGEDWPRAVMITKRHMEVLEKILERDTTARISHGGLAVLLSMTDQDIDDFKDMIFMIKRW